MKMIVMALLTATIIGGGTGAVLAGHGPGGEYGGPPPGMEMGSGGFEGRMAKILKLTETQQNQIKAIFDSEHDLVKPLFDKMHESRKQLMSFAEATVFDEAAVRSIAQEQAATETVVDCITYASPEQNTRAADTGTTRIAEKSSSRGKIVFKTLRHTGGDTTGGANSIGRRIVLISSKVY